MLKYLPTIGLEIHVELKTQTKMFCGCPNDPEEKHPNVNVCPVCLGHPGVLPTINKKALEYMMQIGMALNGKLNKEFKFDRKNYFYPDLPKGYQISQFDLPVVAGGEVDISSRMGEERIIKLNRIHLEEDAARLVHEPSPDFAPGEQYGSSDGQSEQQATLVDFNRGGVPLMELVSEPDMHSAKEAAAFAKELQLVLRYLGVSDADLEHGQMRADANVSISEGKELGIKVEIKNLNSFRAIEEAINFEIQRQAELLENGGKIKQETRGWDDAKKKTIGQRSKEEAHDYRYFPEPDLPLLDQSAFDMEALRLAIPEMPKEKRRRFKEQFRLSSGQADILAEDREEAEFFEEAASELEEEENAELNADKTQILFNYLNSDLKGLLAAQDLSFSQMKITPENFADLAEMIAKKEISSRTAKDLLARMLELGIDPRAIVKQEELGQVSEEGALLEIVRNAIKENPKAAEDYKKGKMNALQFLVGKAMAALKGRSNPEVLKKLFKEAI